MELRKELPEIFDEFAQQRKNSFLAVKQIKDAGKPVVGVFCTYLPTEIAEAMGAVVVGLCSTSDETIPDAEKELPRNLCPLIKSSYGFARTDKCPFFYFSDLIVGETTCDGKKKMYEYLGEFKPVHVLQLPNTQNEDGYALYRKEIIRFKEKLEEFFGVTITEESIREAIHTKNEERKALKAIYELMKYDPLPMKGSELFQILYGSGFKFNKQQMIEELKEIKTRVEQEYAEGKHQKKAPRIIITGSPIGGGSFKVVDLIEKNGGSVVAFENCNGAKSIDELVNEDADDVYESLARRYLNIGCSCMSPNTNRFKLLGRLIEEYQADAVIEVVLTACHTYNVETLGVKRFVTEQHKIPYMAIETDYSSGDVGQLNTRIAAFLEML
jgi:benzoyl-CoA reductase/2-hydroxyglutaryl-CoA dehydratase subunit BcrC/BadD/HgdB